MSNIKKLRLLNNETQEQIGNIIGVNKATISRYESGDIVNMKSAQIRKLSEHWNVSPTVIMNMEDLNVSITPIEEIEKMFTFKVPHYGTIVMGTPIEEQQVDNMYTLLPEFCSKWKNSFTLTAIGESMNRVIPNGSIVQIYPTENYKDGDIVAVCVNGYECTLKRMYKNGNIITLQPDSYDPSFKPQSYNTEDDYPPIKVYGKVVYHLLPQGYEY